MPKLRNRKWEHFALEVAAMTPLDRAYVAAGYTDNKWSRYNASRLANTSDVAERIAELQDEFKESSKIKAEYIQQKLLPLVEANPQDLYETIDDGSGHKVERLKTITELSSRVAAAIQRIQIDLLTGAIKGIIFHNKIEAGGVPLRSVGGVVDRLEVTDRRGPEDMSDPELEREILQAFQRLYADRISGDLKVQLIEAGIPVEEEGT